MYYHTALNYLFFVSKLEQVQTGTNKFWVIKIAYNVSKWVLIIAKEQNVYWLFQMRRPASMCTLVLETLVQMDPN